MQHCQSIQRWHHDTDTSTKPLRTGKFFTHEGNQKDCHCTAGETRDVTETPHRCTVAMDSPLHVCFVYSSASLAFCATPFLRKVFKNDGDLVADKAPLYTRAPGEIIMESVESESRKQKNSTNHCFMFPRRCNHRCLFVQTASYLTRSWWVQHIYFSK